MASGSIRDRGTARMHKSPGDRRGAEPRLRPQGLTRHDVVVGRRRRPGHRRRRFRRRRVAPRAPVVHVATTLLGMVDAADRRQDRRQPARRARTSSGRSGSRRGWCATSTPSTLCRAREMRCGLGEMAKYHFLAGDDLLPWPRRTDRPLHRRSRPRSWRRRARGRPASAAQLRPHARPRARDRHGLRHGPRRSGRRRAIYAAELAWSSAASTRRA